MNFVARDRSPAEALALGAAAGRPRDGALTVACGRRAGARGRADAPRGLARTRQRRRCPRPRRAARRRATVERDARRRLAARDAVGYMALDLAALAAAFAAIGAVPPLGVLLLAYVLGQLGGLIPLPGGVSGADSGVIGAFVLLRRRARRGRGGRRSPTAPSSSACRRILGALALLRAAARHGAPRPLDGVDGVALRRPVARLARGGEAPDRARTRRSSGWMTASTTSSDARCRMSMSSAYSRAQLLGFARALVGVLDRLELVEEDRVDRGLRPHDRDRRASAARCTRRARTPGRPSRTARRRRPCARRREIFGTVASVTALIIFAPWRMIPWRSTAVPIMKPGTSARNSSGRLNALHSQMKCAALSAMSTNSTPPFCLGWLATMPIARPSRRAKPTTSSLAQRGWTSKNDSASTSESISALMSNGLFSSAGMMSRIGVSDAGLGGRRDRRLLRPSSTGSTTASAARASMPSSSVLTSCVPHAGDAGVHPRAAHLLERDLLADDHLGHPRRAEVHRRVALAHDHDVAERGDVRAAGGARAEQHADLRDDARHLDLGVEDPPGAAAAGEHLDLVGDPRAGASRRGRPSARACCSARSWMRMIFSTVFGPHEPAFTVGSLAMTATGRPPTVPMPVTTPSAPRPSSSQLASSASSTNEPSSSSRAMRSRTGSLPCSAAFARWRSGPPAERALDAPPAGRSQARPSRRRVAGRPAVPRPLGGAQRRGRARRAAGERAGRSGQPRNSSSLDAIAIVDEGDEDRGGDDSPGPARAVRRRATASGRSRPRHDQLPAPAGAWRLASCRRAEEAAEANVNAMRQRSPGRATSTSTTPWRPRRGTTQRRRAREHERRDRAAPSGTSPGSSSAKIQSTAASSGTTAAAAASSVQTAESRPRDEPAPNVAVSDSSATHATVPAPRHRARAEHVGEVARAPAPTSTNAADEQHRQPRRRRVALPVGREHASDEHGRRGRAADEQARRRPPSRRQNDRQHEQHRDASARRRPPPARAAIGSWTPARVIYSARVRDGLRRRSSRRSPSRTSSRTSPRASILRSVGGCAKRARGTRRTARRRSRRACRARRSRRASSGPIGCAGARLHRLVDLVDRADALLVGADRVEHVRDEQAVDDEAGLVLASGSRACPAPARTPRRPGRPRRTSSPRG